MERNLFGLSTLIASVALLIWSIGETFAYPQGPNVSLGSNPIQVFQVSCNSSSPVIMTTANETFIITDLIVRSGSYTPGITLKLNGSGWLSFAQNKEFYFKSGLPVPPNSSLECQSSYGREVTVSGYIAHQ